MAGQQIVQFEEFDVKDFDEISQRLTKYIHKLTKYFTFIKEGDDKAKINILFMVGGYDLEQIYVQYAAGTDTFQQAVDKIKSHFNPKTNTQLNRFNFANIRQLEEETFDDFVYELT